MVPVGLSIGSLKSKGIADTCLGGNDLISPAGSGVVVVGVVMGGSVVAGGIVVLVNAIDNIFTIAPDE